MNEISVGIIACASMHEQIRECVASLKGSFKIYPLIPPCTFSLKIDLIRFYLDKSIVENNVTLLAYGICHPQMVALLTEYGDRVVRLRGSNCYEMFLGPEKYAEYHRKCYWMLNKPFFTKYRKELLAGFGAGTNNGRMLIGETHRKLVYLKFENDQLDINLVENFADAVGLEHEVHSADTANLKRLLEEALASASPTSRVKLLESSPKCPEESEIRTILENIGEIIYRINVHTKKFTFISSQTETILGYTQEEFMDIMNDYVHVPFYHEDDREQVIAKRYNFLVKCLNERMQEPYGIEYRVKHKNGIILWVRESIYPSYSPEGIIESFVGKIVDITERKLAEEDLRTSENRLAMAIEASRAGIYDHAVPPGAECYHSPRCAEILGYKLEELPPSEERLQWALEQVHPDDCAGLEKAYADFIEGRTSKFDVEVQMKHKSGRWLYIHSISKATKRDENGQVTHITGVMVDITERKRAEEKIKQSLHEKEVLLREIHHRVKNNLQVVSSLLNLQSEYVKDGQYKKMFGESQNRIQSMALIHEKLYQSENLAEIDFKEYIISLVNGLVRSYEVTADKVSLVIEVEDVSLGIDTAIPCGLIINELVSNSLKHAFPDRRKGEITIRLRSINDMIELVVCDNGVGIPDDIDLKTTESLGLDLVTTLAEYQLDGEITLDRSNGTAFTVTFKEVT
ncbi:MAG: PAS domain-containing protein [Theionarchaea archaeon]|nr:PAS domain-containing protein [Theionarchaea archaeon]